MSASQNVEEVKPARLVVITSDFGAAVHVGGAVATYCRTFDLPREIADYIKSQRGTYSTVSFGLEQP